MRFTIYSVDEGECLSMKESKRNLISGMIASGLSVMAIMWLLFWLKGYAPFGENSLATMDANYQYVDFFSYLKDVLTGQNQVQYSFSKMLGGPCIGIFSYYLSSPFNLLVLLFKKSQLIIFLHVIISLKLACAGVTCAYFLGKRFAYIDCSGKKRLITTIVLSVSYAVSQYSIAQASNVMWLDGVYMLPLILLGVHYVAQRKGMCFLSVMVGLAILFNWYTAGIDCVFASIWLIFEISESGQLTGGKASRRYVIGRLGVYVYAMTAGVLMSAVLFLPTIGVMRYSTRGSLELEGLIDIHFLGNILNSIESYSLGAKSAKGVLSLFCGSVALIGCLGSFLGVSLDRKKKIRRGIMLLVMLLTFYWTPLCTIFSLFKSVGSYWYRYSYVGIICLIFIAAEFYMSENILFLRWKIAGASLIFLLLQIILHLMLRTQEGYLIARTCTFVVAVIVILLILGASQGSTARDRLFRTVCYVGMTGVLLVEVLYGVRLQLDNYHNDNGETYPEYVESMEQLTDSLAEYDGGTYRINQTIARNVVNRSLRANYDESLAYGYWALAGYTSSPDTVTLEFMDRMGYRMASENACAVNTSVLGADSLMGVRYVISNYPISGLKKVDDIADGVNGMAVYRNPYSLPLAMVYDSAGYLPESYTYDNPFVYQNELYSTLLGEPVELYKKLDHKVYRNDQYRSQYEVEVPLGNYAVYGNIPWNDGGSARLDVNGKYATKYARWLSPSVFYIPVDRNAEQFKVRMYSFRPLKNRVGEEQFYALDLDKLAEVTKALRKKAVKSMNIKDGYAEFNVKAREGQNMFVSIPYSDGWTVMIDGEEQKPELIDGSVYSIPLHEGRNHIQMIFRMKYKTAGMVSSVVGMLLIFMSLIAKYRKKRIE